MKNKILLKLIVLSSFVFVSTGCDMVDSIKEYFKKDKDKPAVMEKKPAATQQATTKKPKMANVDLQANEVARIGGWSITKDEFNEKLEALKELVPEYDTQDVESKRLVLDELVNQQLIVLDAEKTGVADNKDIVAAVDEFRKTLIVREIATKLTEGIDVTEEDAKAFYDENINLLKEPTQYKVREVVVASQLEASELLIDILKGEDESLAEGITFEDAAKKFSTAETAAKGGDLGYLLDVPFAEMAAPLLGLEEGEVSSVFKGPKGYYIIKLEEKKGGDTIAFEDVKDQIIENQKLVEQQQAVLEYIGKLREKTDIKVNEAYFK